MGRDGTNKHYNSPLEAFMDVYDVRRDVIVAHSSEREDEHNDVLYLALKVEGRVEANVAFVERDDEGTMIKWCHEVEGPRAARPSLAVMQALDPLPAEHAGFATRWRAEAWRYAERAEQVRLRNEKTTARIAARKAKEAANEAKRKAARAPE